MTYFPVSAIFIGAVLATSAACAQSTSQNIAVDSCVGQIIQVYTAGEPSGLVLSIVNQSNGTAATVLAADLDNGVTIQSVGSGTFAVKVGVNWAPTLLAFAARSGYDIIAVLRYHMNGASFVVEDFRIVQGVGAQPGCH